MTIVSMPRGLLIVTLMFAGAAGVLAGSCGTVASPTSCIATANGPNFSQITYTATGFSFALPFANGGAILYQGADIDIDIDSGGGLTGLLTFTKHPDSPAPNSVFFANPGETSGFTLSYSLHVDPVSPGTVAFLSTTTSLDSTNANNGSALDQGIVHNVVNCPASTANPFVICALSGGTSILVSDVLTLAGNNGNVSINSFQNLFDSTFTAAAAVPEPSTTALIGLGVIGLGWRRFLGRN